MDICIFLKSRKSKYMKSIFEFTGDNIEEIVMDNIKSLLRMIFQRFKKSKIYSFEYNEGDFFSEHRDNKINKNILELC